MATAEFEEDIVKVPAIVLSLLAVTVKIPDPAALVMSAMVVRTVGILPTIYVMVPEVATAPLASVTLRVNVKVPIVFGNNEIAPVEGLIDMPVGKAPEATAKVYEVFPPLAEAVVVDALLIGMVTSDGAEIDNAVEIET